MAKKQDTKKNSFFGNWIVKNIIIALVIVVVLVLGAMIFLNVATQHNRELAVPDFVGMTYEDALQTADSLGIRLEIIDSVYSQRNRGKIKSHTPGPGAMVKDGRRILLTVNAVNARQVSVPNLVGYSLRQAIPEINQRGLKLGRLIYKDDIATNNVLGQLYKGRPVRSGTMVDSGSSIDLVVGLNSTDNETRIPDLAGTNAEVATRILHDYFLNVRRLNYDRSVMTWEDSLSAVVYKQSPAPSEYTVRMGTDVTVYLKKPEAEN